MERAEAIAELSSTSSHARLRAARELARAATPSDLPVLRSALRRESVSFVKRALEQAVARVQAGRSPAPEAALEHRPEPEPDGRAYTRAVAWVTNTLLHEILPRVGGIRLEARRCVPDYQASDLKKRIDGLEGVLAGIEDLQKATKAEAITAVNLFEMIDAMVADEAAPKGVAVSMEGDRDLDARADANLLKFAVCNGLRNALEATAAAGSEAPVVISWGATDVDYWIAIIDRGSGPPGPAESAFGVGSTTKSGHRGFGLAIARQAMTTLDGNADLSPAANGGARFEVRWFK